jgi:uncharacterized protein
MARSSKGKSSKVDSLFPRIHQAIQSGDITKVQEYIQAGDNIEECTYHGMSPVELAVEQEEPEIMQLLLNSGADPNFSQSETPLVTAVGRSNLDIVRLLVDAGADINNDAFGHSALIEAVHQGCMEIVMFLVEQGADINALDEEGVSVIVKASRLENDDILNYLKPMTSEQVLQKVSTEQFFESARHGRIDMVNQFLAQGISINIASESGRTALAVAAIENQVEMVQHLISSGAQVSGVVGEMALKDAVSELHHEVVKVLLEAGVDPNTPNTDEYGLPCLLEAICPFTMNRHDRLATVHVLLEYGVNRNVVDDYGKIPLHYAQEKEDPELVALLEERDHSQAT